MSSIAAGSWGVADSMPVAVMAGSTHSDMQQRPGALTRTEPVGSAGLLAGEVVLRFHKTNIVRIKPNGDVILTSGVRRTVCSQLPP